MSLEGFENRMSLEGFGMEYLSIGSQMKYPPTGFGIEYLSICSQMKYPPTEFGMEYLSIGSQMDAQMGFRNRISLEGFRMEYPNVRSGDRFPAGISPDGMEYFPAANGTSQVGF